MKEIRVLVVDDAYFMRELIVKELTEFGCKVVGEAKNGKEAIAMYKKLKPDLVTMDIKMPEIGGIEAINEIKNINPSANIMVITGVYESQKEALNAGALEFLKKPFQPAFLWSKLDKLISDGVFDDGENVSKENEVINKETGILDNISEVDDVLDIKTSQSPKNKVVIVQDESEDDLLCFDVENYKDNQVIDNLDEEGDELLIEIVNEPTKEEVIIEIKNNSCFEDDDSFVFPNSFNENYVNENKLNRLNEENVMNKIESEDKNVNLKDEHSDPLDEICINEKEFDSDEGNIVISIRPPRFIDEQKNKLGENKKYHEKSNNQTIEPPIINYKEQVIETDSKKNFLNKIKNILKLN